MKKKTYTIQTSKDGGLSSRPTRVKQISGTVEELTQYFGYTLAVGNSHDKRVNEHPKTIKSLLTNLTRAFGIVEGCCYSRTSIDLITVPEPTVEVITPEPEPIAAPEEVPVQLQSGDRVIITKEGLIKHSKSIPSRLGYTSEEFEWRQKLSRLCDAKEVGTVRVSDLKISSEPERGVDVFFGESLFWVPSYMLQKIGGN